MRHIGELSVGAILVPAVLGLLTYWGAVDGLGWSKEHAWGAAGAVIGVCSGGWIWPLWWTFRHRLGRIISPGSRR